MAGRLVLVEPDASWALSLRDALVAAGYTVDLARAFEPAVKALSASDVSFLITSLRLGAYNGLHLVLRTRFAQVPIPAILMGAAADHTSDVDRLDVEFLTKPVDPAVLVARVGQMLAERASHAVPRRWPRKSVHLQAVVENANMDIVDLSYGGLRLEIADPRVSVGTELSVNVPSLGVSVTAVARWSKPLHEGGVSWCGAEIIDAPVGTIDAWRGAIDSMH